MPGISQGALSSLRAPLLAYSALAASFPIEVILSTFCAVTLVYFKLLKLARESEFLLAYNGATFAEDDRHALESGTWMLYAVRVFLLRFWELAKNADSADVVVMLIAYTLMHITFVSVFINFRRLASSLRPRSRSLGFWITLMALLSSTLAFFFALITAWYLKISVDPVLLGEALPFLVITIGFEKPQRLARAVFTNPGITASAAAGHITRGNMTPLEAPSPSLNGQSNGDIKRFYSVPSHAREIIESAVEFTGVAILREYAVEIIVLVLGSLSNIEGVKQFCQLAALILIFDGALLMSFFLAVLTVMVEVQRVKLTRYLRRSDAAVILQDLLEDPTGKDSSSDSEDDANASFKDKLVEVVTGRRKHESNPVSRLKILLIASFLILHALNLVTTLTTQTAHSRPKLSEGNHPETIAVLNRFMTKWSAFVGDPVVSKWIIVALACSVILNGYLLRDVSLSNSEDQTAEAAARILLSRPRHELQLGKLQGWNEEDTRAFNEQQQHHERELASMEKAAAKAAAVSHKEVIKVVPDKDGEEGSAIFIKNKRNNLLRHQSVSEDSKEEIHISPSTVSLVKLAGEIPDQPRDVDTCVKIFSNGKGAALLSDEEIIMLVQKGKFAAYALEKLLGDLERSVAVRRALISRASVRKTLEASHLPYQHFDYSRVMGQCCENVVGFMPIPVGIAGPLRIDGDVYPIPMATTEGALVASASRGCKALNVLGGVTTVVTQDAMTRGPALGFPSVTMCATAKRWIDSEEGSNIMKAAFNSTSRFARLKHLKASMAGRTLYVRFGTQTGDAMGMNMISKGCEKALEVMTTEYFPEMKIIALSGNFCIDKKPAAINWIEGRGKSVVAEGIIPGDAVRSVLKTTVQDMVSLNISKNLIGSSMAGSVGGNNAQASNILTAIYLATGQDPAQNVESSMCMTLMEAINDGKDLLITCSMPSIEVGTVGGGTTLQPQAAMLDMLGCKGPHPSNPGENAQLLARIICAAVMAGELSLMASLAAGTLVKSHLALNRSAPATPATVSAGGGATAIKPTPLRESTLPAP